MVDYCLKVNPIQECVSVLVWKACGLGGLSGVGEEKEWVEGAGVSCCGFHVLMRLCRVCV
jgi:hypothetical protein